MNRPEEPNPADIVRTRCPRCRKWSVLLVLSERLYWWCLSCKWKQYLRKRERRQWRELKL